MGELIFNLAVFLALFLLGLFAGRRTERNHLRELAEREAGLTDVRVSNFRGLPGCKPGSRTLLVAGEVTIASDYFKTFVSGIRNLFGGEIKSLQQLQFRARREAMVRLLTAARAAGFNAVGNIRFDAVDIGGNAQAASKNSRPMATVLASGTAYEINLSA
jgi:uncharacterized protein YbjQ (UPF0145 family)